MPKSKTTVGFALLLRPNPCLQFQLKPPEKSFAGKHNETSARPLLGADVDQCLQTSSHLLNQKTIGRKNQKTSTSRFSPTGPLLLPIFLHLRFAITVFCFHLRHVLQRLENRAKKDRIHKVKSQISRQISFNMSTTMWTADVWSTSSAAEACRCGPQTADVLASKKQTPPKCL
ncbi:hypothetical protein LXL04_000538 [Taraxacum kok-saghyz]